MKFGFPGLDNVRSHRCAYFARLRFSKECESHSCCHWCICAICRDFVMSYDRRTRTAHWVFEHLTRDSVKRNEAVDRNKSAFSEDNSIHRYFRSQVRTRVARQTYLELTLIFTWPISMFCANSGRFTAVQAESVSHAQHWSAT